MAEITAQEVFALLNPAGRNRVVLLPTQAWELYNYIEQQQQQIERLKCCGNCINWRNGNVMQCMLTYRVINSKGKCKEWQGVE